MNQEKIIQEIKKITNKENKGWYSITKMKKEMMRRRFSQRTIESYSFCAEKFLKEINKDPRYIKKKEIRDYLHNLAQTKKTGSTLNVYLSAIKFLMEDTLRKDLHLNMKYSRRPKSLPTVLTKEETKDLFNAIKNNKHKLMIQLLYSAGIRVSELLNLKVKDLESDYGWIRAGKGNKDRLFIVADKLKEELKIYIKENNLDYHSYLFQGFNNNGMSPRTIQEIIKKAKKKSKIKKHIHPHTLRHSFATHLIEDKNDVTDVQKLLGHNSINTTMIYVHAASPKLLSIKSPLDNL